MIGKSYLASGDRGRHQPRAAAPRGRDRLSAASTRCRTTARDQMIAFCRLTHKEAYFDIFMVSVIGPLLALVAVLGLGSTFGSF